MKDLSKLSKSELIAYIQEKEAQEKKTTGTKLSDEYFSFIEKAPYSVFIHAKEKILHVNKTAVALLEGKSKKQILERPITDFMAYTNKTDAHEIFESVLSGKELETNHLKIKTEKGNDKYIEIKAERVVYENQQCIQTIAYDVSETKKIKKELSKTQNYLSFITEKTEDVIFRIDIVPELSYKFISPAVFKLTGYPPEAFYKDPHLTQKLQHPEQPENANNSRDIIFERPVIHKLLNKNKETVWTETINTPIFSENKQLIAIQGITRDITLRIKTEEEAKKQKESYKNLVQKSPFGILIHDGETALYANDFVLNLLNAESFEKIEIKDIFHYILPKYHEAIKERISNLKQGKEQPFFEFKVKTNENKIIDLEIKAVPVIYDGKQLIQVIINDPGTKKELEREKMRAVFAEEVNKKLEKEIEEKTAAQQQLLESKLFVESIINSSLDMIIAVDNNNKITEFNKAAEKAFGYKKEEVIGKRVDMLFTNQQDYEISNKILDENLGFYGEVENKRKNGTTFTSLVTSTVLKSKTGEKLGVMGLSRDITEIRKNEQKIKDQAAKINSIFQNTTHLIYTIDKDFKLTSFNNNFAVFREKNFGQKPTIGMDMISMSKKIYKDDELEKRVSRHHKAMKGVSSNYESHIKTKNNDFVWLETHVDPIILENNKIEEATYIVHDITEKKLSEKKIINQSAKINSIIQNSSHIIFTVDKDFKLTSFNNNFILLQESVLGVTPKIGMEVIVNSNSIYTDDEVEHKIRVHKKAMQGFSASFENKTYKKNGEIIWLETYIDPIVLENNKIEEATYIVHNITEKKQAEQAIKESLKEKEILLKEVHHRVKNNLQVISSIINLQSSFVKDTQSLGMLKDIQNRIKTMSFIHESLYQTKDFSSINFSEYVVNLSQNLVHSFRAYEQKIDINVEAEPIQLSLDQSIPCGLVINELITNAFKYAFIEKDSGEVKIKLNEKEGRVTIEVADNGVGMPKEIDFKNTESLGLQLVVTLIEQLDGKIELKSKKGTKFVISFTNSLKNKQK